MFSPGFHGGFIVNPAHAGNLLASLKQIPDPRGAHGRRHSLSAMLATVVCAVLCGARGFSAIAQWIHVQPREVWWMLGYYRTPPTENTFRSLLSRLDPAELEAYCSNGSMKRSAPTTTNSRRLPSMVRHSAARSPGTAEACSCLLYSTSRVAAS